MKSTRYSEIENKYDGAGVDAKDFNEWATSLRPLSRKKVRGYDIYYRQGTNVVRHRYNGTDYNALTVKCRKSCSSIQDRVEVDLLVNGTARDVSEFLDRAGFRKEFSVWKEAYIYHVDDSGIEISLALYDVSSEDTSNHKLHGKTLRFIEVEVEKSDAVSTSMAKKTLKRWNSIIRETFGVDPPLGESLYEIFGSRRYKKVGGTRG